MDDQKMKERFVSDQSARELAPLLNANQRALVSFLATAALHDVDLKHLMTGFAEETDSGAVREFAELLPARGMKTELHALDIANKIGNLMPRPCKVALNSARASGSLHSFYRSWLAQTVDERINWVRHENTNAAMIGRLAFRTFICIWLLIYIVQFVVPEHMRMYEEFGLELNNTFSMFLRLSALLVYVFPILLACLFLACLYIVCFRRSVIKSYLRRWMPGKWRQVNLPKSIMNRKLMAWDLLAFRGAGGSGDSTGQQTADEKLQSNWDVVVASGGLRTHEAEIMKSTTQLETQAWLLRNMADRKHDSRKTRVGLFVSTVSFLFQVILAVIIILATFSIFSMLLEVMRGLS